MIFNPSENSEQAKGNKFNAGALLEYKSNSIVEKTLIKRITGSIAVYSVDSGKILKEKIRPFDTYIQVIDGCAEIVINEKSEILITGESIIIPAHLKNHIYARERLKLIVTVIKSGYEEMI